MLEHRPFSAVLFWQFWTFEVAEKITLAKKCQRDTMILLFTSAIRSLFAECWHGLEKLGYKRGYANLFPKENQKIYLAFQLLFKADLILLAKKRQLALQVLFVVGRLVFHWWNTMQQYECWREVISCVSLV